MFILAEKIGKPGARIPYKKIKEGRVKIVGLPSSIPDGKLQKLGSYGMKVLKSILDSKSNIDFETMK